MRDKIVAANWKMNGSLAQLSNLCNDLTSLLAGRTHTCKTVVFPPFVYLSSIHQCIQSSPIVLGAQNVYPANAGAFTGEISGPMLNDFGCRYVLVGHSERRQLFNENEKFVAEKFHHVKEHGMIPLLCVGETLSERESGQTEQVIAGQLMAIAENNRNCFRDCVIAYEPIWAIGTGKTAEPEQAQDIHHFIRALVADVSGEAAAKLSILYGGSVNEQNAGSLFSMPDIDGGLVGGASLDATKFVEIIKCIN